jgi:hypothetical protein
MKPKTLHAKGNQIVTVAGKLFGQLIIYHEGEISAPDPDELSPCYGPVK